MIVIYPRKKFEVVSISNGCELMCDHCKGRYIKSMRVCKSPEDLYKLALNFEHDGKIGFLVSGGYNSDGYLININKYLSTFKKIKERTSLKIIIHSGFLPKNILEELSGSVDRICVDVVGSTETLKNVLHLNKEVEDVVKFLDVLEELSIDYSPHLIAGLHYGKVLGEPNAINILKNRKFKEFIFLTLLPTRGTPMQDIIPRLSDVLSILNLTRDIRGRKILGCMRIRLPQLELSAIDIGYEGIVMPLKSTLDILSERSKIMEHPACCAVIP